MLSPEMLSLSLEAFAEIADWRCELLEFGGESAHIHILVDMGPVLLALVLFAEAAPAVGRGVVTAMLGVEQGTSWTVVFVACWFVVGLLLSFLLTVRLEHRRDR